MAQQKAFAVLLGILVNCVLVSGFYYVMNEMTPSAAKSHCESLGLRLAVFETQAEWEEARAFLNTHNTNWGKSKNVSIGLQRDLAQSGLVYKWIDGSALTWGSFYNIPWKDVNTPVDDPTKACVKMEWGSDLRWKHHDCAATEDFLCEGFFMNPSTSSGWYDAKSSCEGMGMKLASLKSDEIQQAAEKYIAITFQNAGSSGDVWHGLYKTTSSLFTFEDGTACTSGAFGCTGYTYPWVSSEPDSSAECIRLKYISFGQYKWADNGCTNNRKYLCQGEFFRLLHTFDESKPPARFGIIGLAIGFSTFIVLMTIVCGLWFCCIRNKDDYRFVEEEEEEKPKGIKPLTQKPHGIKYIA
ncbi:uncharacterized protein LOC134257100 [Saccostrea cucullata]|uniref:uncharacterized protein LOC134257100 n=1 Tax=Saccostrea cuccullata TaxID=36930 RepID=UPI002ED16990